MVRVVALVLGAFLAVCLVVAAWRVAEPWGASDLRISPAASGAGPVTGPLAARAGVETGQRTEQAPASSASSAAPDAPAASSRPPAAHPTAARVRGSVSYLGQPSVGTRVWLRRTGEGGVGTDSSVQPWLLAIVTGTKTDERGDFLIDAVVPGVYDVVVEPQPTPGGALPTVVNGWGVFGDTHVGVVTLSPSAAVEGRVTVAGGGATQNLRLEVAGSQAVQRNARGEFRIDGLAPGPHELCVRSSSGSFFEPTTFPFAAVAGRTTFVAIDLRSSSVARVHLRVLRDGTLVPAGTQMTALCRAQADPENVAPVRLGPESSATRECPAGMPVTIELRAEGTLLVQRGPLILTAGEERDLDLELAGATGSLRVEFPAGFELDDSPCLLLLVGNQFSVAQALITPADVQAAGSGTFSHTFADVIAGEHEVAASYVVPGGLLLSNGLQGRATIVPGQLATARLAAR